MNTRYFVDSVGNFYGYGSGYAIGIPMKDSPISAIFETKEKALEVCALLQKLTDEGAPSSVLQAVAQGKPLSSP